MTKQEAALRQIHAAIRHLHAKEYECAVTLAGAAESMCDAEPSGIWAAFMKYGPSGETEKQTATMLNATRDWLKHPTDNLGGERYIDETAAGTMLIRAISRFESQYNYRSKEMEAFRTWCATSHEF